MSATELIRQVAALPPHEKARFIELIYALENGTPSPAPATLVEENGRKVLVTPPGAPPMTPEAIKALHPDIVNITGLVPQNLDAETEHRRHQLDKH